MDGPIRGYYKPVTLIIYTIMFIEYLYTQWEWAHGPIRLKLALQQSNGLVNIFYTKHIIHIRVRVSLAS